MTKQLHDYKFQKCSDVEKELPIFEVVADDGTTIMDISMNDESKSIEVFFHDGIKMTVTTLELVRKIIDEGEQLLVSEMTSE